MAYSHWLLRPLVVTLISFLFTLMPSVVAYEVPLVDTDYSRQTCSGMWGGPSAYINVTFDNSSQGQLAMVIYEWADVRYLGKEAKPATEEDLPQRIYVCTSSAVTGGYCTREQLGLFILDLPAGKTVNETSIWSARVELPANKTSSVGGEASSNGFWDNPAGNPTPPADPYASPWRRDAFLLPSRSVRQATPISSSGTLEYTSPIHYPVPKTGFYCVAAIPVTVQSNPTRRADTDVPYHPTYKGTVLFQNTFKGRLPATDYPKVNFYFLMFIAYAAFGALWAWFCYRHMHELLPIQYYLSGLVGLLVIEMLANWVYYRYLNAHGKSTASTVFLIVVAILDAGRNSMSFFMLLVVSLGLSVVRESLGKTMLKCQALAGAHFLFGILYAIGIVELELESTSALVLLLFIIPLAFTLSGFLLWIMYALNATIAHLRSRKQRYKLKMFERLYYILLFTVLVIAAFFVVSSMSFSGRLAEGDYGHSSMKISSANILKIMRPRPGGSVGGCWTAGWLSCTLSASSRLRSYGALVPITEDKSLSLLNTRMILIRISFSTLAMSDEIAQDEEDAEDYDLEAIQSRSHLREEDDDDDDAATLVAGRRGNSSNVTNDDVVFEIGDEDDEDDEAAKRRKAQRLSGENHNHNQGPEGERLMS
ncbi:hypothetical protein NLJ89_g1171 [Agrocybe chaxingu]|uniref:Uncharacterized protein n=1 Tax=Agrocybe chaxingu TaxID=84603 RepID=A0A9W8N0F7_9AGAR|nr:hypothetical protein NLJ89_g1171 [Agrocybe chaxingu]